jgi:hypothetical protein
MLKRDHPRIARAMCRVNFNCPSFELTAKGPSELFTCANCGATKTAVAVCTCPCSQRPDRSARLLDVLGAAHGQVAIDKHNAYALKKWNRINCDPILKLKAINYKEASRRKFLSDPVKSVQCLQRQRDALSRWRSKKKDAAAGFASSWLPSGLQENLAPGDALMDMGIVTYPASNGSSKISTTNVTSLTKDRLGAVLQYR